LDPATAVRICPGVCPRCGRKQEKSMTFERSGESYSKDDKHAIRDGIKNRVDLKTISDQLKRSPGSIWAKAQDMKLHPGRVWYMGKKITTVKSGEKSVTIVDKLTKAIVKDHGKEKEKPSKVVRARLDIDSLSEEQCADVIKIFETSGNSFFRDLGSMGIPPVTIAGYYDKRKTLLKKLRARFDQIQNEKIKVKKIDAIRTAMDAPDRKAVKIPPVIIHPAKNTPDVETLLVKILNENKLQTELLSTLARKAGSAS
jgi:hypothetical protein